MRCSVVIPLFNKTESIATTLRSALGQTHAPHEIIVVDDGSTDGSAEAVRALGDARVRLVHQVNAGVSVARNRGIEEATGELVAFLDADDWWHPRHIETIVDLAQRYPRHGVFATCHRRVADKVFPGSGWDASLATGEDVVEDVVRQWMRTVTFFTSSIAVRRLFVASLQPCFPPGENYGEDLDFHFRLNEHMPFVVGRACTVAYRVGDPSSLSRNWRDRQVPPFIIRLEERVRSGITPPPLRASRRRFTIKARTALVRRTLIEGDRVAALGLLREALPTGLAHRSFWVTALMLLLAPGKQVLRWEQWRQKLPR